MNKKLLALLGVTGAALCHSAFAMELWDPHVRATDVGQYAGMLPPQGVYFVDDNIFAKFNSYNANGNKVADTGINAYVNVPIVLWATGLKVLGGSYAVGIAQPFDYTSANSTGFPVGSGPGNLGLYNTVLIPGIISWDFHPLFVSAGLSLYLPDGTNNKADLLHHIMNGSGGMNNGGLPSANGYSSIEPDLGLTYLLPDGFSASASFHLAFPIGSTKTTFNDGLTYNYHSGSMLMGDYTIGKNIGPWEVGIGGATQNQLSHDSQTGTAPITASGNVANYSLSAFASYQFKGGISVAGIFTHGVATTNDIGGDLFNLRLTMAL